MNRSLFTWLGVGVLLLWAAKSFGQSVLDQFKVGKIKLVIQRVTIKGIDFYLNVPIINPLPVGLPIDSFRGVVRYGQYVLADVFVNQPMTILSGDTHVYKVDGQIGYDRIAANIVDLVDRGDWKNKVHLDGMVISKGLEYNFSHVINVI